MNPHSPLFSQIADGDEKAFTKVYHAYCSRIYYYIVTIVKEEPVAAEINQDVFDAAVGLLDRQYR